MQSGCWCIQSNTSKLHSRNNFLRATWVSHLKVLQNLAVILRQLCHGKISFAILIPQDDEVSNLNLKGGQRRSSGKLKDFCETKNKKKSFKTTTTTRDELFCSKRLRELTECSEAINDETSSQDVQKTECQSNYDQTTATTAMNIDLKVVLKSSKRKSLKLKKTKAKKGPKLKKKGCDICKKVFLIPRKVDSNNKPLFEQWLWLGWQICHFRFQRSIVRIQSSDKFYNKHI